MNNLAITSIDSIPRTQFAGMPDVHWLWPDEEKQYRDSGGHPIYGVKDVVYSFNSAGYRAPEFESAGDAIKILALGCSETFGYGLPREHLFHEIVAGRLRMHTGRTVVNWNLAVPGGSGDRMCRMLVVSLPLLQPDIVLLQFPSANRREYFSSKCEALNYHPNSMHRAELAPLFASFKSLTSPPDDFLNLFRRYKLAAALLRGRKWLHSFVRREDKELLSGWLEDGCVGTLYGSEAGPVDRARDQLHAGPRLNLGLAELYWNQLQERGWLDSLRQGSLFAP